MYSVIQLSYCKEVRKYLKNTLVCAALPKMYYFTYYNHFFLKTRKDNNSY